METMQFHVHPDLFDSFHCVIIDDFSHDLTFHGNHTCVLINLKILSQFVVQFPFHWLSNLAVSLVAGIHGIVTLFTRGSNRERKNKREIFLERN